MHCPGSRKKTDDVVWASVSALLQLAEEIRNAVDDEGWKHCFDKSVNRYHDKTGLPIEGLWAAVEGVVAGYNPEKLLKRLHKSWGGSPEQWVEWFAIAKKRPDC